MTWWTPDHIGEVTAVATTGLALATTWMAWKTANLTQQEERHHQDGAMPICVLGEASGSRTDTVQLVPQDNGGHPIFEYHVYGPLRNIGPGPALDLRLTLRFEAPSRHQETVNLDPLGAGDVRGVYSGLASKPGQFQAVEIFAKQIAYNTARRIAIIPIRPTPDFNEANIRGSVDAWAEIILEYRDVFGTSFCTTHPRDPRQQWAQFRKGTRPVPTTCGVRRLGGFFKTPSIP